MGSIQVNIFQILNLNFTNNISCFCMALFYFPACDYSITNNIFCLQNDVLWFIFCLPSRNTSSCHLRGEREKEKATPNATFSRKDERRGAMKRFFVPCTLGFAVIIALTMSAQAAPEGSNLHGEYSMIGTRTCAQASGGADFTPPNYSLPAGGGTTRTAHYNAILIFHGDGTGEFVDKVLQINHNAVGPGGFPTLGFTDRCDTTYQGAEDGTIQLSFHNCVATSLWNVAGVFSSSDAGPLSVTVSANGDTLLMSNVGLEPDVETTWTCGTSSGLPDCTNRLSPQKRICARSFTAIRLSPRP